MSITHFDYGTKLNKDTLPKNIPSGTAVAAFSLLSASQTWVHYTAFVKKDKGTIQVEAYNDDTSLLEKVAVQIPAGYNKTLGTILSDVVKELNLIS